MRSPANISWRTHQAIKVGRLLLLGRLNVLPGDSLSLAINHKVLFSKLRRNAGITIAWETFGFYSPWRWTYGDSFITAATSGWDSSNTYVTTKTLSNASNVPALQYHSKTIPTHLLESYAETIDHYFKEPHQPAVTTDNVIQDRDTQIYGYRCWQLRDTWQTSMNWSDAHEVQSLINQQAALDVPRYIMTGRDNQLRQWDAVRKEDIYRATYNGKISPEALKRPIHLHYERQTVKLQAEDYDQLEGTQIAAAQAGGKIVIPKRYYPEHGTVYIYGLARVRPSYWNAIDFLDSQTQLGNMKTALGHPVGGSEGPKEIQLADLFADATGSTSAGYSPWDQWHLKKPDYWSPVIEDADEGWPARDTPTTKAALFRHPNYDDIWSSLQFGHGLVHCGITASGNRAVGSGRTSIMSPSP